MSRSNLAGETKRLTRAFHGGLGTTRRRRSDHGARDGAGRGFPAKIPARKKPDKGLPQPVSRRRRRRPISYSVVAVAFCTVRAVLTVFRVLHRRLAGHRRVLSCVVAFPSTAVRHRIVLTDKPKLNDGADQSTKIENPVPERKSRENPKARTLHIHTPCRPVAVLASSASQRDNASRFWRQSRPEVCKG